MPYAGDFLQLQALPSPRALAVTPTKARAQACCTHQQKLENSLCHASQTDKDRQKGTAVAICPHTSACPSIQAVATKPTLSVSPMQHGTDTLVQPSAQRLWQTGALVSQGAGPEHHHHRESAQSAHGGGGVPPVLGGKDNCTLGEKGGHACVFRRSRRPQLGHSKRSLLQHKGIKALHWASRF